MNNKISFLGSAGDIKSAGKFSSSGGVVVSTEGYQIHIDPGTCSLKCAKEIGINLRDNDVVIATNNSTTNSNDMNVVLDYMTLEGEDKHGVLIASSSVINGSDEENPILKEGSKKNVERIIGFKPGDKVGLGEVNIIANKINARDESAIGILIETPIFKMGYVPHSEFSITIAKSFVDMDILILSLKNPSEITETKCLNLNQAIKFVETAKPRLVIFTNLGYRVGKESSLKVIREIQKETKVQTMVASEGLVVNASSYKAVKQSKLD